jgi:hypothetical protein
MRPQKPIRTGLIATLPLLALTLTACGSDSTTPKVASAQTGSPRPSASSSAAPEAAGSVQTELAQYVSGQRKWVACLRKHGLDVGDPDAKGLVDFSGAGRIKEDPQKLNALKSCDKVEAAMPQDLMEYLQPKKSAKEIADSKAYAACMQENGAPDFPDFDDQGYQPMNSTWNQSSSQATHALVLCTRKIYHQEISPDSKG